MFNKGWYFCLLILAGCGGGADTVPLPDNTCTATLTWEYPVVRLDGTTLSREELQKLTIYVNEQSGMNEETIERIEDIMDINIITWEVRQLNDGVHWFYLTVTDVKNTESGFSNEESKLC